MLAKSELSSPAYKKETKAENSLSNILAVKADAPTEENDHIYSKFVALSGFDPWAPWVPMPYPHRELTYARGMYMRGENLIV